MHYQTMNFHLWHINHFFRLLYTHTYTHTQSGHFYFKIHIVKRKGTNHQPMLRGKKLIKVRKLLVNNKIYHHIKLLIKPEWYWSRTESPEIALQRSGDWYRTVRIVCQYSYFIFLSHIIIFLSPNSSLYNKVYKTTKS